MIHQDNNRGSVNISESENTEIVGTAAANCFGVKGMAARSLTDGVYHLLRKESVRRVSMSSSMRTIPFPLTCTSLWTTA